jgi:hypothetical protein
MAGSIGFFVSFCLKAIKITNLGTASTAITKLSATLMSLVAARIICSNSFTNELLIWPIIIIGVALMVLAEYLDCKSQKQLAQKICDIINEDTEKL